MSAAKILVVDDTPANVKLLADLLAVKGYAVVTAANGEEAVEIGAGLGSDVAHRGSAARGLGVAVG